MACVSQQTVHIKIFSPNFTDNQLEFYTKNFVNYIQVLALACWTPSKQEIYFLKCRLKVVVRKNWIKYCLGSARFIPTIPYQSHCSRVKIITMKYSFLCFCVSIISGHCGCDDHVMMGRLETSSCICLNHISPA